MERWILTACLALALFAGPALAEEPAAEGKTEGEAAMENPTVVMTTSAGTITIELYEDKAPITVENFLQYVDDEHYDGTIFHRVIRGFMIQGGGFDAGMNQKPVRDPIKNEASNGLGNEVGTLAMARTGIVDSATSQFFINTVNNVNLNHRSPDPRGFGYCVFGKVIDGMDVVHKIERSATGTVSRFRDVPLETITIESVRRK